MFQVSRGVAPHGFQQKSANLLAAFYTARNADPKTTPSKFWSSVRKKLREEATILATRLHFKCAFCESRASHVQNPHIEHYRPKGRPEFEHLMFDWNNWLLSCGRCNESKWQYFPDCGGVPCLLDPALDDPIGHVEFCHTMIEGISIRGWRTIQLLDLQRVPLTRERGSWLIKIDILLLLAALAIDANVKTESRRLLLWSMQADAPYSAMTKRHLRRRAPKLAQPAVPHPHISEDDAHSKLRGFIAKHRDLIVGLA